MGDLEAGKCDGQKEKRVNGVWGAVGWAGHHFSGVSGRLQ